MRLDWIEDILAVAETGSFQTAAARRRLSQPAFSRRMKAIEDSLGAPLFDRGAKPARLLPRAEAELDRMRALAGELRDLAAALGAASPAPRDRLALAAQHAITTAAAPAIAERLTRRDIDVRLRSANRDDCLGLLLTGGADLALVHDVEGAPPMAGAEFLETAQIGSETLTPVFAADAVDALNAAFARGELPVIAYPEDVFLGAVQRRRLFPKAARKARLAPRLETALTLAALQCARAGLGVAWTPLSLAAEDIARGTLVTLDETLPTVAMRLLALRVRGRAGPTIDAAWAEIAAPAP